VPAAAIDQHLKGTGFGLVALSRYTFNDNVAKKSYVFDWKEFLREKYYSAKT